MGTALAQDPVAEPARKGRHHERGDQPMPAVETMMRGILSEEQKTGVKAVMRGLKAEERPLLKQMKADHEQLKELVKAESFDEAAVAALAEKEGALAADGLSAPSTGITTTFSTLSQFALTATRTASNPASAACKLKAASSFPNTSSRRASWASIAATSSSRTAMAESVGA